MGLNFILAVSVFIQACISGTGAGNSLGSDVTVTYIMNVDIYLCHDDGAYDPNNGDYTGLEIPHTKFEALCEKEAELAYRTRTSVAPSFRAFIVDFSSDPMHPNVQRFNFLHCPADPNELYIVRLFEKVFWVYDRFEGQPISMNIGQFQAPGGGD